MSSKTSRRSLRGCAATLAALALAGLGSTPAIAGVAEIRQCAGSAGDLLDGGPDGSFMAYTGCPDGGTASLLSTGGSGAQVPVGFRNLTLTAPGSTTFVGGRIDRQMHNYFFYDGDGAPSWAFGYVLSDAHGSTLESCGFGGSLGQGNCFTDTSYHTLFPTDYFDLPAAESHAYTMTVGCGKAGYCHHWWANPGVAGVAAQLLVRDDAAPVPTAVTGPLATVPTVHEGDTTLALGASDADGLGVYDARLLVDDALAAAEPFSDNGGRCVDVDPSAGAAWTSGRPCPESAAVRGFSFPALPEGAHNLKLVVRDAALNATVAMDRDVTVDLIPAPSQSTPPVVSGTPKEGGTLAVDPGTWDGHGRSIAFGYRWLRCDAKGEGCVDTGSRTATREISSADFYHSIVVEVTASTDQGSTTVRTAATPVVRDAQDRTTAPPGQQGGGQQPGPAGAAGTDRGALNGENASDSARLSAAFSNGKRSLRTAYGRHVVIRGRLTTASGAAIRNAKVELRSTLAMRGAKAVDKGGARTRGDGTWTLILPKDVSSRALQLRYRSHLADLKPAAAVLLKLSVRAGLRLAITPRVTHNFGTIHFSGRVLGHSIPKTGKVVELQARGKGQRRWITFKTVRSSKSGLVRAKYRFHASSSVSYQFRARARAESGYPFLTGISRRVTVHVR